MPNKDRAGSPPLEQAAPTRETLAKVIDDCTERHHDYELWRDGLLDAILALYGGSGSENTK